MRINPLLIKRLQLCSYFFPLCPCRHDMTVWRHMIYEKFHTARFVRKVLELHQWRQAPCRVIQFTVSHTNTSVFNIQFSKLYLHLLALFLTKDCLLYKEVGLVLVSRNSAAITFTSSLLQNLVIGLFKIFSILISELVWILAN